MAVGSIRSAALRSSMLWSAAVLLAMGLSVAVLFALYQNHRSAPYGIAALITALAWGTAWITRPGARGLLGPVLACAANRRALPLLVGATGVTLLVVARLVLDAFPNSGDEYAQVLQASTYAQGRLWMPAPENPDAFLLYRFPAKDGVWISQYLPGWSLVLTPFAALDLPLWIVNPLLGAACIALFHALARKWVSAEAAWLATLVLSTSVFFQLNYGSFFNHGLTTFLSVAAALFIKLFLESGRWRDALIAGALVGYAGLTRPLTAAILIIVFALAMVCSRERRLGLLAFGAGGLPLLAVLLAYNDAVTGNPLLLVPTWLYASNETLQLPRTDALQDMLLFSRLKAILIWTSPIVFVGWLVGMGWLATRRKLDFTDWIAPITILSLLLYAGEGGNQYGPRYYFEALPFLLLTGAKAVDLPQVSRAGSPLINSSLVAAALLAHFAYQAGFAVPRLALEHRVIMERQEIYRLVEEAGVTNAVVLIATPSSPTRVMWPGDLVRNGVIVGDEDVTYAHDLGEGNDAIRAMFPDRRFYRYEQGSLTPID